MQTQAGAVLPTVSTLLSHLQQVSYGEDEGRTAREPDRRAGHKLNELYKEIKQQDSEQLFSQDNGTEWGTEIASEIRCSLSLRQFSDDPCLGSSCLSFAWTSLVG